MTQLPVHSLDGRLLRLFLEVYECNSVSRAAERLGLTQSTVSHGLDRLRRGLEDPLFVKDGRNIVPTAQADYLAPRIRAALSSLEALSEPQDFVPARETRPVTIACNAHELQDEALAIFRALRRDAPELPVRFVPLNRESVARALMEDASVDLAIGVHVGPHAQEFESQTLLTDRMAVFYDPAMRGPVEGIEDFAAARHAVLNFGGGRPSLVDQRLSELGLEREIHLAATEIALLGTLLRGTDMITTMQARFAATSLSGLAHCPAPIELPLVHYDMVWHSRHSRSRRHLWLRAVVMQAAGQKLP
ncbi:LysR family transcriptional regulator [Mangrovicoccus ximenensis]|uniref:LysR family transcriptional regulator n=1 Tax=Mangrovicoccus ximenensis TaxID=1911570 RepID=UPI001374ED4E|nr:LysR family transcriptional regulator [Mangrovicoccus ximenensis]